jgi:oxygen-independent coproporphyrinogen-3 oxidase
MRYNYLLPMTLGIYIQVPFCQTKCTYCNFHTGVVSRDRYEPYAAAICREIELEGRGFNPAVASSGHGFSRAESEEHCEGVSTPEGRGLYVDTVYFGGGTPSLLDPASLEKILNTLRTNYNVTTPEITLEADPETITPQKAAAWLAAGFNRLSLGAQSFNDLELQSAGRMHRRADIYNAAQILRAAGFENISMDLIAGLAHQSRESWEYSTSELLRIRPEHVSIYMLEIDEGSHLGKESLAGGARYSAAKIPSDDTIAEFYESACQRLAAGGYEHYEISNWALPGRRSHHNLKYWHREPYLGFGAGAHSFDGATRWANIHDSARYVACIEQGISPREQVEGVTSEQALQEEFFLGLRQLDGIDLSKIQSAYAHSQPGRVADLQRRISRLRSDGLVEMEGSRLRLAPNHLTISNEVLGELLA